MGKLAFKELQQEYLVKLYEMSEGNPYREIKLYELHRQLQSSNEQQLGIISQLSKEGLVTYTFGVAMITPDGIIKAEKYFEEPVAEKHFEVLCKIYNMCHEEPGFAIALNDLEKELNTPKSDFNPTIKELKRRDLIEISEGIVWLSDKGKKEIEDGKKNIESASQTVYIHEHFHTSFNIPAEVLQLETKPYNMLNPDELKIKSERFLITLYFMAGEKINQEVKNETLFNMIWVNDIDEKGQIIRYTNRNNWINWNNFENTFLTSRGLVEVKKLMKSNYAEREYSVLESIYELGNGKPKEMVKINELASSLHMSIQEINPILEDLESRKGLIGSIEEAVWILPAGIEEIEKIRENPEQPTDNFPANVTNNYNTTINAPVGAFQQNTQHSTQIVSQTINTTNNPEFDKAIASILQLIQEGPIDKDEKEELNKEVENINNLALKEPSQNSLEKAKLRLSLLETLLKSADLFGKAAPYLPAVYGYFEGLTKQLS